MTEKQGHTFVTREVTVEGPIAFVETTTLSKAVIFPEDLNRGLILKTDSSEAQNRRAILEMAKPYSVTAATVDTEPITSRHHAFQDALEYVDVRIPYVEKLAGVVPATEPHSRRVFGQVAAAIEAIAFLHQHHRGRDKQGRLLATAEDYALARRLLLEPLRESIGLSGTTRDAYRARQEKFKGREFTSTEAIEAEVFHTKPTRDKELRKLVGLGVIVCAREAVGNVPAAYRWTGKARDELVLPSVRDMCGNA
jgi:hypothetical protein